VGYYGRVWELSLSTPTALSSLRNDKRAKHRTQRWLVLDENPIGGNARIRVMMKSTPSTPLEVLKAEFLLGIQVVAFSAPARFDNVNKMFDSRRFGLC
jgi:hypothetical protein